MPKEQQDKIDVAAVHAALEDQGHPWRAEENELTELTRLQRRRRLGVPLPSEAEQAAMSAHVADADLLAPADSAALPAVFDLRNVSGQSYVSGIRDQGNCGSCVAFASVAVVEGTARYGRRLPALEVDLSEAHLFYGWGATVGVTCATGWLPAPALTFVSTQGITYQSDFPYLPGNPDHTAAPAGWQSHRALGTGIVDLTKQAAAIKQHLVDVGPVTGCFVVYDDFFSYRAGVYRHVSGDQAGGHCVAIVGYDDVQGAWIVKNSWDTGWGQQGFGLIAYGEGNIDVWSNIGINGVQLRTWTAANRVLGGYATGDDRNSWVYVEKNGWLHVGGTTGNAHLAMFDDLLTAKAKGSFVNAYTDDGLVTQVYAY